nr:E3 ubiquitin-protein ligase RNF180-like isoform X1 [Procambarus clarkii]XP_045610681.1 E3 ubiquitin-protein ligase RNF180-like isoform X1 [Procambarus clarkii]XP_045610682.1 E3 ubiquitin-protein ligase RNF180-like isoform X1 [Procambarus clarkii]
MVEKERVQCRKCRKVLLFKDEFCLLDAHSQEYHDTVGNMSGESGSCCPSVMEHNCLYLSEESFPAFILTAVNESSWTKGKINCPSCQARLGSFNFVSGSQCACGSHVLPQVHILRSKVDWMKIGEALPRPVSFPDRAVALSSVTLPFEVNSSMCTYEDTASVEAVATRPSGENINSGCSPAQQTALKTNFNDLSGKSSKPRNRTGKSETSRKSRQQIRHEQHVSEDEIEVRQSSNRVTADIVSKSIPDEVNTEKEEKEESIPESLVCPVCLDVLYSPLVVQPCGHKFCEPCLRRLAQPNPTYTHCPLCRQIIGECMPCPELATEVRENFSELYEQRRQFEKNHNSQHLPLPWDKNYRWRQIHHDGRSWVDRAGGWSTVIGMGSLYILGIGIWLYLVVSGKIMFDTFPHSVTKSMSRNFVM